MADLPSLALSVRQPWAWAIIHGGKDIENRTWRRPNPGLEYRGDVAIHAAQGMTRNEFESAELTMALNGADCPRPDELKRGGIIGIARIVDVVRKSDSPWFFGPVGFVLTDPRPVEFIRASGNLGFFDWRKGITGGEIAPAKWMLSWGEEAEPSDLPPALFEGDAR